MDRGNYTGQILERYLAQLADNTAIRYGCSVWLVGSLDKKGDNARDIDIIIVLDDERFMRLFGSYEFNDSQFKWRLKERDSFEMFIKGWDFDIKPQRECEFLGYDTDRRRLDQYSHIVPSPTVDTFEEKVTFANSTQETT